MSGFDTAVVQPADFRVLVCDDQASAVPVQQVLGFECNEPELMQNPGDPGGAPICDPGANPTKALLSGEHQVRITCTERASDDFGNPATYGVFANVAIVINIVHVSPDDRKHQLQVLKGYVSKEPPRNNPAESATKKLLGGPLNAATKCSSS